MGRGARVLIKNQTTETLQVAPYNLQGVHQGGVQGSDFLAITGLIPPGETLPQNEGQYIEAIFFTLGPTCFNLRISIPNTSYIFDAKFYVQFSEWKCDTKKLIQDKYRFDIFISLSPSRTKYIIEILITDSSLPVGVPPGLLTSDSNQDDSRLCVVCLDKEKSHAFFPCGHMCVCEACVETVTSLAPEKRLCPICRVPIDTSNRIFQ